MVRTVAFARLGETWCRPYLLCKPDAGTEHAGKLVGRGRGNLDAGGVQGGLTIELEDLLWQLHDTVLPWHLQAFHAGHCCRWGMNLLQSFQGCGDADAVHGRDCES